MIQGDHKVSGGGDMDNTRDRYRGSAPDTSPRHPAKPLARNCLEQEHHPEAEDPTEGRPVQERQSGSPTIAGPAPSILHVAEYLADPRLPGLPGSLFVGLASAFVRRSEGPADGRGGCRSSMMRTRWSSLRTIRHKLPWRRTRPTSPTKNSRTHPIQQVQNRSNRVVGASTVRSSEEIETSSLSSIMLVRPRRTRRRRVRAVCFCISGEGVFFPVYRERWL